MWLLELVRGANERSRFSLCHAQAAPTRWKSTSPPPACSPMAPCTWPRVPRWTSPVAAAPGLRPWWSGGSRPQAPGLSPSETTWRSATSPCYWCRKTSKGTTPVWPRTASVGDIERWPPSSWSTVRKKHSLPLTLTLCELHVCASFVYKGLPLHAS